MMMVSSAHCVAGKGKYVAIVSTTVETNDPKSELEPGIKLLGRVIARFDSVADSYEPTNDSAADKCFISQVHHATRRRDANGPVGRRAGVGDSTSPDDAERAVCATSEQCATRSSPRLTAATPPPPPRPPSPALVRLVFRQTYDATSHFGTSSDDVLDLYRRITGTELDMNINADNLGGDY